MLEKLPRETVQQLLAERKVPIESIMDRAEELRVQGQPKKALSLLEPLFHGQRVGTDRQHEFALDTVFNLYDELGYQGKKKDLIQRVIETAPASPLSAAAYQRLATIRMDQGDRSGAWDAFQKARNDDPDNPMIGVLEVHLLVAEKRTDEARERSRFLVKRLRKLGHKDDEGHMEFLISACKDPEAAMNEATFHVAGPIGERLKQWLDSVTDRAVPVYLVEADLPGVDLEGSLIGVADQMRKMGIPQDQIPYLQAQLRTQAEKLPKETGGLGAPNQDSPMFIMPPEEIEELEDEWQEVFPMGKPFSVNAFPFNAEAVWDPDEEDEWIEFLEHHPLAFDSLEILDDLATSVFMHPEAADFPSIEETLLEPLLRRAQAIIGRVLKARPDLRLDWGFVENRPALRLLARLTSRCVQRGHDQEARALAEQMLALNPNDNHGFRCLVMNRCLIAGEDEQALQLADRYPDDVSVELLYGRVLALYRMDRLGQAEEAARWTAKLRPKVLRYLIAERVRKPKMHPSRVTLGGDDEAWFYREEMREVWMATPGAVAWLKKISSMKSGRELKGVT